MNVKPPPTHWLTPRHRQTMQPGRKNEPRLTNPEPLPKGHALWKFDNVVITPHIAGQSDGVNARQMELFKENIAHFVKGQPLVNVVDKQKGY